MSLNQFTAEGFDWNELGNLRLRASAIADGLYVGIHRSARRGVGVEFGGRRNYVPGDDLRWLDRHALMRHGKLLVREFETDTDRLLYLVIDATASMSYQSKLASVSKWVYARTVAAALTRIALSSGDPVALDWIGGENARWLPAMSGREAFDRVISALETTRLGSTHDLGTSDFKRAMLPVSRYARRGTIVILLSDLLDLPEGSIEQLGELSSGQRTFVAVRVLDTAEITFPFEGATRFVSLEGDHAVETDAKLAKAGYLAELEEQTAMLREQLTQRGGRFLTVDTQESPVETVRRIVELVGAGRS
jgi:uncharacterized protein (DUF58 family)